MRAEGPRKLDDIDFRQASYDSRHNLGVGKEGVHKKRQREVTFDVLGDELVPTSEPVATQKNNAPELKIVRGVPTRGSDNPFGETAMSKTMLQPTVRIVDDELRDSEVFVDDMKKIDDVRDRIKGMGSTNDKSSRKSA